MLAVLPSVHGAERNLEISRKLLLGDVACLTDLAHEGSEIYRCLRRDRIRHLPPPVVQGEWRPVRDRIGHHI